MKTNITTLKYTVSVNNVQRGKKAQKKQAEFLPNTSGLLPFNNIVNNTEQCMHLNRLSAGRNK